ncbi:MAG TPA: bifunctional metallophosphatase/5'-nucleotidase [Clostridiales bacterium]|nr:bifunctional metallophosphatase/5'-nucleotidase [Clostridiales bacterium]
MKRRYKILPIFLVLIILFAFNIARVSSKEDSSITILFTHDLHDHFYPFDALEDGKLVSRGGYARLSTAIKLERDINPELILVDAGDFSMGTLFQTIFASSSPALRIMGQLGYDATTFGNHEFDFRAEGLADSLNAATNSGDTLPAFVASNILFPLDDKGSLTPSLKGLKNAMNDYGVKDYIVINRNGIKIGIFGLVGKDADSNAPMSEVLFDDPISKSKEIVNILKTNENVDLIVCLSHSGTWDKKSDSEDEILAKEVPEIDVIISGHTHTAHKEPIIVGNTYICSYGRYGENLGKLTINQNSNKQWSLNTYVLKRIDDNLEIDEDISKTIDYFRDIVQKEYLDNFNMTFDDVLAYSPFNFTEASILGKDHREDTLGNLISDSYIYAVKKAEGPDYEPIAATVVPYGIIRDSFVKGNITTSQVFTVSSLGIGPDKVSGYPLITVYLTGKELKTTAEVDASITPLMDVAQLYISGLNYTFNPNRLIFDKVTDIYLSNPDGSKSDIKDDQLYRVVVGLYSAQMLSVVGDKSYGLLSIIPKTKDGTPITDYEAQIIYDGEHELKEWLALAGYLKSFPEENGIPHLSDYYKNPQGRKIVDDNKNIFSILKSPNKIWIIIYSIIVVIITFLSTIIVFFVKRKKKKSLIKNPK